MVAGLILLVGKHQGFSQQVYQYVWVLSTPGKKESVMLLKKKGVL
jgi:hypothetical protein